MSKDAKSETQLIVAMAEPGWDHVDLMVQAHSLSDGREMPEGWVRGLKPARAYYVYSDDQGQTYHAADKIGVVLGKSDRYFVGTAMLASETLAWIKT